MTSSIPYNQLEKVLSALPDGILVIDKQGEILYINEQGIKIAKTYMTREVTLGDQFLTGVSKQRTAVVTAFIGEAFLGHSISYRVKSVFNSTEKWFEIGYDPLYDEKGDAANVMIRIKDITRGVELEEQIEKERQEQKSKIIKAALSAQEKERAAIGKELHDNVNQVLTTVKLYNELCLTEEVSNRNLLLKSVQQINFCIDVIRGLSKMLTTPSKEEVDLATSIKELAESISHTGRMEVRFFSYGVSDKKITQDLYTAIYRIAQEQLTNVLKYAAASLVEVMLVGTSHSIALRVQDNGKGFDRNKMRKGLGISNMIARTKTFEGEFDIKSSPGNGCSMMAEFPLY